MARDLHAGKDGKAPASVVAARREFASLLSAWKAEAFRIGLIQTAHQMDRATRMVGYEIAALETGTWPVADLTFLDQP